MHFKVGDFVMLRKTSLYYGLSNQLNGKVGVVSRVYRDNAYSVAWGNRSNAYWENDLCLATTSKAILRGAIS